MSHFQGVHRGSGGKEVPVRVATSDPADGAQSVLSQQGQLLTQTGDAVG